MAPKHSCAERLRAENPPRVHTRRFPTETRTPRKGILAAAYRTRARSLNQPWKDSHVMDL